MRPPAGWNTMTAAECDLSSFRPGVDALAMVGGHGVDAVDVDPKAGGSIEHIPPFRHFGVNRTPSGGTHYLVRSTGIAKISPLTTSTGHIGDYVGGTSDGRGRALLYLPGSHRPKYPGSGYSIEQRVNLDELVNAQPDPALIDALGKSKGGRTSRAAATSAEVSAFLARHSGTSSWNACPYGRAALEEMAAEADAVGAPSGGGRHKWAVRTVARTVELIRGGCATAEDLHVLEAKLQEIKPEGGTNFNEVLAWAVANATGHTDCRRHQVQVVEEPTPPRCSRAALDALLEHLRSWQDGEDLGHVVFALAVGVSAADPSGEPLWGMIVGPPSSGKTEAIRTLDDITDDRVDELTAAALLSWSKGKIPRPVGVLTRVPNPALLTVGDFSTVLATSDRGGRDQLFALLRRVFDGHVARDLGNATEALRWSGRLTMLAAVTPAIDDYSSHSSALGPRWLYLRMAEPSRTLRRRNARQRTVDLAEKRATARRLAAEAVRSARNLLTDLELTDDTLDVLAEAAELAATARGAVPRDGYGKRGVIGMPVIEEPYRLVAQLQLLTRSLLALGMSRTEAEQLAVRAALDTIPRARLAVLEVLATGEVCSGANLAKAAGLNRTVAQIAVADLRELGLACCPVEDDATVEDMNELATRRRNWQLTDDLGHLATAVLADQARGGAHS